MLNAKRKGAFIELHGLTKDGLEMIKDYFFGISVFKEGECFVLKALGVKDTFKKQIKIY